MVNKFMVLAFAACVSLIASSAMALEGLRPTVTFSLASRHLGFDQQLNERNPGVSIGFVLPVLNGATELAAQAGFYKNSFEGWSRQISAEISTEVGRLHRDLAFRVGASIGFADYGAEARHFRDAGVPVAGADDVLFGGPTLTLRYRDHVDFKTRIIPMSTDGQVIMTFEIGFLF